jgi:hypothetical protein
MKIMKILKILKILKIRQNIAVPLEISKISHWFLESLEHYLSTP